MPCSKTAEDVYWNCFALFALPRRSPRACLPLPPRSLPPPLLPCLPSFSFLLSLLSVPTFTSLKLLLFYYSCLSASPPVPSPRRPTQPPPPSFTPLLPNNTNINNTSKMTRNHEAAISPQAHVARCVCVVAFLAAVLTIMGGHPLTPFKTMPWVQTSKTTMTLWGMFIYYLLLFSRFYL